MLKFRYAVFCFYMSGLNRGFYSWLLLIIGARRAPGYFTIGSDYRAQVSDWALDLFEKEIDRDSIIRILVGDEYFDRNKRDIAKLERIVKKSIFELWDTDPVFAKFVHLRGLARNKEFEATWAKDKKTKSR